MKRLRKAVFFPPFLLLLLSALSSILYPKKFLTLVSSINDDAEETLTVNITEIIPILVKAIQEQQTLIDSQKSKIENLETAVLAIQNQLGLPKLVSNSQIP